MKPHVLLSALTLALPCCEKQAPPVAHRSHERETAPAPSAPRAATPADASAPAPPDSPAPADLTKFTTALALPDEAAREDALVKELNALPPETAANLALNQLPADPMRGRLLNTLLTTWAVGKPSAAAAWLAKAPDFPEKSAAIRTTADLWQRMDLAGTLRWIAAMPEGPLRTAALGPIAAHIRTQPAEHREECLRAVTNPDLRAALTKMVAPAAP